MAIKCYNCQVESELMHLTDRPLRSLTVTSFKRLANLLSFIEFRIGSEKKETDLFFMFFSYFRGLSPSGIAP